VTEKKWGANSELKGSGSIDEKIMMALVLFRAILCLTLLVAFPSISLAEPFIEEILNLPDGAAVPYEIFARYPINLIAASLVERLRRRAPDARFRLRAGPPGALGTRRSNSGTSFGVVLRSGPREPGEHTPSQVGNACHGELRRVF
jgi:hypothetical protein